MSKNNYYPDPKSLNDFIDFLDFQLEIFFILIDLDVAVCEYSCYVDFIKPIL